MKRIAIDIETTGLHPWGGKIFCVAYYDGKKKPAVITNPNSLKSELEDPEVLKVIHNAAFDGTWLYLLHGIRVRNVWDTKLAEQVILGVSVDRGERDPAMMTAYSSSLKHTLVRYGFIEPGDMDKSIGAAFAKRDRNAPLTDREIEYAKGDVEHLLKLHAAQEFLLKRDKQMEVALLEMKTVERVIDMRTTGIGFDHNIWSEIARANEFKYAEIMKRMPPFINWNSPVQVKQYFMKRGIMIDSLTDLPEVATRVSDPVLDRLIELRDIYKSVTTYGLGWLTEETEKRNTVDPDGRVRCDFTQIVSTGRFSSSRPNMQQLPKNGDHRKAFVPRKGHVFINGDFSGQEIGIMAAASNERIWIEAMLRGDDVHSLTASLLYASDWAAGAEPNCAFPKKCKCPGHQTPRDRAKGLNFMLAYGGGAEKFSGMTGLTLKEAKVTIARYKKVVRHVTRYLEKCAKETERSGESFSADPYRRRRFVPQVQRRYTIGKNNPIQAAGANMLKLSMISMPEEFPLVMIIHDQIILEVPKAKGKQAALAMKTVMEKAATYCTGIAGLIKVEPKITTNLYEK